MFGTPPKDKKVKVYLGIRNCVTNGHQSTNPQWKYLVLYEIDSHNQEQLEKILRVYRNINTSFVCYETLNGYHFIGLTPFDSFEWGKYFNLLQTVVKEYFSGQTIRMSRKHGEEKKLIAYDFSYPYLTKLASIYIKRFDIPIPDKGFIEPINDYHVIYEKYWSSA